MAEHYALGIAGGPGSIDDGGDVHRFGLFDGAVAGIFGLVHTDEAEIADIDYDMQPLQRFLTDLGELLA